VIPLDNFLKNSALPQDVECVVLHLGNSDDSTEHRFVTAFKEARDRSQHIPFLVFTMPHGADGWSIQAIEANEGDFWKALESAVDFANTKLRSDIDRRSSSATLEKISG